MNTDKLNRIKEALRLTVKLGEGATTRPWKPFILKGKYGIGAYETTVAGWIEYCCQDCEKRREANFTYIAHACNTSKARAETLLKVIEKLESFTFLATHSESKIVLNLICDSFPDDI